MPLSCSCLSRALSTPRDSGEGADRLPEDARAPEWDEAPAPDPDRAVSVEWRTL